MSDTPRPPWPDFRLKEPSKAELAESLESTLSAIRAATIEECATICRGVGEDWKKDGDYSKQHAAEYLAELLTTGEKK